MKNIMIIFWLLVTFSISAQNYSFDVLTKYLTDKREIIIYSNSKNDNYFLKVFKNNELISAELIDMETSKKHHFNVLEIKNNYEITFEFSFNNSSELFLDEITESYHDYVFDFETIEVKDSIKKVQLKIFKNAKKKRPKMEYDLEIKDYDSNIFPAFRVSVLHPLEGIKKLNFNQNGIVIKASGNTLSGNENNAKLLEFKEVNLELVVKE